MLIDYKLYVREVMFNFLDLPTPDIKMDKQITPLHLPSHETKVKMSALHGFPGPSRGCACTRLRCCHSKQSPV